MIVSQAYFDFISFCLSDDKRIPDNIDKIDWDVLLEMAKQQAIIGLVLYGMQKLPSGTLDVPEATLSKYIVRANKIRKRNLLLYKYSAKVAERLKKDGFRNCILKGQGNALMYPSPYIRAAGDIDIWLEGDRETIVEYARKYVPKAKARYHHIDFPVIEKVPIELHFMPCICNNWIYNRRLQRFFSEQIEKQCTNDVELPEGLGSIPVPTLSFNRIYQMAHMMHHFFDEGIGLRQMIDYYFLLKKGFTKEEKENDIKTLKHLNLYRFAGAVMYVEKYLGLDEKYLLVPVDEKRGKTLMDEILRGGNFGKYSGLTDHSTGVKYFLKIKRNLRFAKEYPAETMSEPLFRTWHFFWRFRY